VTYAGDGATTAFSVPFKFISDTDLVVILRATATSADTVQTIATHYAVSGAGVTTGGTVTMHTPPTSAYKVIIYNDTPLTQGVDYVSGDAFPAETHERALDKLTLQQQRTRYLSSRSPQLEAADEDGSGTYDAKGNRIKNLGTPTALTDAVTKTYVDAAITNAEPASPISVTATGSSTARTLANRFAEVKNVLDYGAVGDGSADDTSAIQDAIDAAEADGGGTVEFPMGRYKIAGNGLTVTEAVMLRGIPGGERTSNPNGAGQSKPGLVWGGASWNGVASTMGLYTMIRFGAYAVPDDYIHGGGVCNLMIDGGANGAAIGIRTSSTTAQEFSFLAIRTCGFAGILIDGANATGDGKALQARCMFRNIKYTWGAGTSNREAGSHGIWLGGGDPVLGVNRANTTQNHFDAIYGLVYNGDLVHIVRSDNNHFTSVQGVTQAGGTGKAVRLANGTTSGANANHFTYVSGDVHAESNTKGNHIQHSISEGMTVTMDSGAQLHYQAIDYVNYGLWRTHSYLLSDEWHIPVGAFALLGHWAPATAGCFALQWDTVLFAHTSSQNCSASLPAPSEWSDGEITGARLYLSTNADPADGVSGVVFEVNLISRGQGYGLSTPIVSQSFGLTLIDIGAYRLNKFDLTFSSAVAHAKGDWIGIRLKRIHDHGSDTYAGDVCFLGMDLMYTGEGPDSGGSGPYTVGPWEG
jgi:hypothetical protein